MRPHLISAILTAFSVLNSCATVDSTSDVESARDAVASRVAVAPTWSSSQTAPWHGQTLSALDAVTIALERNAELRRAVVSIASARAALAQAETPPNPMLTLSLGIPLEGPAATAVTAAAMQQLAWLWQHSSRVDAEEARLRSAILIAADRAVALAAEVRTRHVNVVAAEESLVVARGALVSAEQVQGAVVAQMKAGALPRTALLDAETRCSMMRRAVALAEGELHSARVQLLESMGCSTAIHEWTTDRSWPSPPAPPEMGGAIDQALARRLDVAAADLLVLAAEADCRTAGAERVPSVSLGAEYQQMTDGTRTLGPALSAELPIFDGGNARIATAMARLEDARWAASGARQTAAADTQRAVHALAAASARWEDGSERARRDAAERLRSMESSAAAGLVSPREVMEAASLLAERAAEAISDRLALASASISLERSLAGGGQ